MEIVPVWKDYPITILTSNPYVDYTIALEDGTVIYTGRAYKLPGRDSVEIIPNEVCAPYVAVTGEVPLVSGPPIAAMARKFTITESGGITHDFAFNADYSYQPLLSGVANYPVNGRVSRLQKLVVSAYNTGAGKMDMYFAYSTPEGEGQTDHHTFTSLVYTVVINMPLVQKRYARLKVTCGPIETEYEFIDTCSRYILYYVNAFGAWDSLLVDGMVKQTDDYTRTTFKRSYVTTAEVRQPRGTVSIQNDITRKYSLVTGWLTDEQSGRMHHLLGSNNVYLFDTVTGQYLPVVLTTSSCEYKTYRNQGAHLVNYTIEAEAAQNYTRR